LAADCAVQYRALRADMAAKEWALARGASLRVPSRGPTLRLDADEYAFARETIRRIATPWDQFFEALEDARSDRIALLSIEPDVDSGTVSVSGEAQDYLAALTYLAQLAEQRRLARVHLVRHELKGVAETHPPLAFTISAAWRDPR